MLKLAGYFPYGAIASCIGSGYQIGPSIAHGFALWYGMNFRKEFSGTAGRRHFEYRFFLPFL